MNIFNLQLYESLQTLHTGILVFFIVSFFPVNSLELRNNILWIHFLDALILK